MSGKLKIEQVPINALRANAFNTNVVSPDNEAKIDESLKRFGFFKPVLCRETPNGLEILGGEHRWLSAKRLGYTEVPVINLGLIDDRRAKEIGLVDNGRYGADDTLQLAELLDSLGSPEDLAKFMPYTDADFASIFSSVNIALDDLDLPDDDGPVPSTPAPKPAQTHSVMRFKVPLGDDQMISEAVEKVKKHQGFTEADELTNAGDALVYIFKKAGY